MIQEIAPYKYRNEYHPVPPQKGDSLLIYNGRNILIKRADDELIYPTFEELEAGNDTKELYEDFTYLFQIDGRRFYRGSHLNISGLDGYEWTDIQLFQGQQTEASGIRSCDWMADGPLVCNTSFLRALRQPYDERWQRANDAMSRVRTDGIPENLPSSHCGAYPWK